MFFLHKLSGPHADLCTSVSKPEAGHVVVFRPTRDPYTHSYAESARFGTQPLRNSAHQVMASSLAPSAFFFQLSHIALLQILSQLSGHLQSQQCGALRKIVCLNSRQHAPNRSKTATLFTVPSLHRIPILSDPRFSSGLASHCLTWTYN